ncbi:tumor necrosis factor ligand superfamily member 11 [Ambystoma mexicanum]|uniref:tumor necrosis factor ligand superfamily member 11 n=1 Tax=Ambystoma mexicanum TaxID=8296 RepID=UPI0037E7C64A
MTGAMTGTGAHRSHQYLRGSAELGDRGREESLNRQSRLPRCVLLALVSLGVAQVASTLGLIFYFRTQMGPGRTFQKGTNAACLGMLFTLQEDSHLEDMIQEDGERNSDKCTEVKQVFRAAVDKEVQRILKETPLRFDKVVEDDSQLTRRSKYGKWPLAHLTINLSNSTWGPEKRVNLTSWNYKEGWANISNMTYNHGKLKVNQDGFYYVYANICFRHHETSKNSNILDSGLQLMLYISKSNNKRKHSETLMKGGSTKYWSKNSIYHFYSVYQGGIFKLRAGDEIFIEVSNPSLLDPDQDATYYGAFRIPDFGP